MMKKIKVLFDNQIFGRQKFGGISRYFVNLIDHIKNDIEYQVPKAVSNNIYFSKISDKNIYKMPDINFPGKINFFSFINNYLNLYSLKHANYDIFHPTYYSDYFISTFPKNKPFIVTIHDMIPELYPEFFGEKTLERRNKKKICDLSSRIIAISESTKNDLINFYKISPNKIDVIYHGSDLCSINKQYYKRISWLPAQYVLYVGSRIFYKNFSWMITAIANLLLRENIKLVVIGQPFNNEEINLIKSLDITDQIVQNNVNNDAELKEIYANARVFIFPSQYEGFGIPVLEAFSSGTPVILSDNKCFREIAKDSAIYFQLGNANELCDVTKEILHNELLRNELIKSGYERVKFFSWKICAQQTINTYKQII